MLSFPKLFAIVIGCLLIAAGIDFFLMPIKVLDGGIIGIALIANYLFEVRVGLFLFLCSIPVFVYAWFKDRTIVFYSLYGMLFLSYFIDILEPYMYHFRYEFRMNPFTSSVIGGLLIGVGFGTLLRYDTSTGGLDLLAKLITDEKRMNVGIILWILDAIIVSIGGLLFSADTFFLSVATVSAGGITTSLFTAVPSAKKIQ
ncbi:YitT family protein [Cohnella panacarvi]|uniref:YitT family protein n=1 Tax=Cohnella panacarvi TaxID=400776 RepID=UPI00047CCAD1|nr:YitT family protein [Cohnella panacarvi]